MKTVKPERCMNCGVWAICTWSIAPIRRLCEPCHEGIVGPAPEATA